MDGRLVHAQGALAQLVARFHGMEEVRGSSPLSSTIQAPGQADFRHHARPSGLWAWLLLTNLLTNAPVRFRFMLDHWVPVAA